jgi:hypothetical protein
VKNLTDNNIDKYIKFCEKEINIPIFSKSWWLDAVCGKGNWGVALVENDKEIIASMPFYIKKKIIFTIITMPVQTQTMGPYIKYPHGQKYKKRLSFEKKIMTQLIEQLPKVDMFIQSFNYNITNWLPFYWAGYKQSTNYTYVIEDLSNLDLVFANFNHSKKNNIKRAKNLVVKFDLSAEDFYKNHKMTLAKQNAIIEYSFEHFNSMYNNAYRYKSGRTLYAIDKDNNIHSALFIIWDSVSAYNLISSIDPKFRNSGSATLLIKEAIKFVSTKTNKFDFEGSMIEGVENSFRAFGAIQKPYFSITKTDSKLLKIATCIRD